ncbi:pentapeptide repeat-containing protein [Tolypothrix sp. PCC 7910]|uniref:pentapeptide repeat-containing protein n=1 Tax=Tolypothrix sp. PCC 7910 TaxID=2099387 RepID=UPI00142788DF|nr:pentapeptide repeat-containing protein [Tolypothrix sp. PCC 7910]QIR37729.1 pentapeptide repeat-containing protein [Tolypothrix sp. PCC 7910]
MTKESTCNFTFSQQQPAQPVRTLEVLLKLYAQGHRNFSGSDLRGVTVNILEKEIKYLDLREIILKESNLTAIVFYKSSECKVDLTGADLSNCNLQGADLSCCRLDQCNFNNSDLRRANLSRSSCRGSDFIQANLQNFIVSDSYFTDFTASNFAGTNFSSSYITGQFSHANFSGCNFYKATLKSFYSQGADFSNADLRDIQLPAPTTVDLRYSYYNHQTKFSKNIDPIAMGMELIENEINLES